MAKEKPTSSSIAQVLQSDMTVQSESLQIIQEDWITAEKERLHAGQKRKQLLDTLRQSVKKIAPSSDPRQESKQEYIRLIRSGVAADVESASFRLKKELQFLRNKNYLSREAETQAERFHKLAEVYQEKKKLYESLEKKIQDVKDSSLQRSGTELQQCQVLYNKLVKITLSLRADLIRIIQGLLSLYEDLEEKIGRSIGEEGRYRTYYFACAQILSEAKYVQLLSLAGAKSKLPIDQRIAFYKQMVDYLSKRVPTVAARVHRLARSRAREALKENRLQEAEDELRFSLHAAGDQVDTWRLLAKVFYLEKKEDSGFSALLEVLRMNPLDVPLRQRVALYWKMRGNPEQAIHQYEILLQQSPDREAVRRELGLLLFQQREYSRAIVRLQEHLQIFFEDTECRRLLGIALTKTARYAESLSWLLPCYQEDPRDTEVGKALALAYRELRYYAEAEAVLLKVLQSQPDALEIRLLLGNLYQITGRLDAAVQVYADVQARQPESAGLRLALGRVLVAAGRLDEAIFHYECLCQSRSCPKEARLELGECYRRAQRFEEAERTLKDVCREDDDNPSYWQSLGGLYMEMGQWDLASAALLRADRRAETITGNTIPS